jgi:hypothetical protein
VREAFKLREEGYGYRTIVRKLHAESPPKVLKDGTRRALAWNPASVRYMVRCNTYRGIVVDPDLWDRANAVSNRGFRIKEATRYDWPLGGALKCECGRRLIGNPCKSNWDSKKIYTYRYYVCLNPTAHDGKSPRFRAEKIEAQVVGIFARIRSTPSAEREFSEKCNNERPQIESRIQSIEHQIATLSRHKRHAWDTAAQGGISNDDLRERLKSLEAELDAAHRSLQRDKGQLDALLRAGQDERRLQRAFDDMAKGWHRLELTTRRETANLLSEVVGGLYVTSDGTLKTFLDLEQDCFDM